MKIKNILIRDLRILLSDKKTLVVILLMPIILTSILSFSLAGVFGDDTEIPQFEISVVKKYDQVSPTLALENVFSHNLLGSVLPSETKAELIESAASADLENVFFNDFLGHEEISEIMTYKIESEEAAYERLKNDEISAIVILPENFLTAGYTNMFTTYNSELELEVVRNPERTLTPGIAVAIVEGFMDRMSVSNIRKNAAIEALLASDIISGSGNISDQVSELVEASFDQEFEITYIEETTSGRSAVNSRSYYSAGMLTLFLLFSAGRGSYMLLEENRNFTYQRMLTAGISKWKILSGKFFVIYSIALIQLIALVLFSTTVLGVYWGEPMAVVTLSAFTAFAVAGLGALLAVVTFVSENTRVAGLFESVIFQVMGLLGGSYIPIEVLPEEVQLFSKIPLNGVALKGFLELMSGAAVSDVTEYLVLLIANGVVFAALAIWMMKRKGENRHVGSDQAQVVGA